MTIFGDGQVQPAWKTSIGGEKVQPGFHSGGERRKMFIETQNRTSREGWFTPARPQH
jgi:hypothetical protein